MRRYKTKKSLFPILAILTPTILSFSKCTNKKITQIWKNNLNFGLEIIFLSESIPTKKIEIEAILKKIKFIGKNTNKEVTINNPPIIMGALFDLPSFL